MSLEAIAQLTIALAAVSIGYFQWRTAERQSQTEVDKLRIDTFEKRYAIYKNIENMIDMHISKAGSPEYKTIQMRKFHNSVDEAVFFFPSTLCLWLKQVRDDCDHAREILANGAQNFDPQSESEIIKRKLMQHYYELTNRFASDLAFRRLTQ